MRSPLEMERILLLVSCLMLTATSAIFWPLFQLPRQQQSVMNVCIYSVDPARYQPKCILCRAVDYPSVLQTCVNAAAIPRNISYTQASCIEQNCAIRRGKRSVGVPLPHSDDDHRHQLPGDYEAPTPPALPGDRGGEEGATRDEGGRARGSTVVGTEEFFASDASLDYDEEETLDDDD